MKDVRMARFCDQVTGEMEQVRGERMKERVIEGVDGAG